MSELKIEIPRLANPMDIAFFYEALEKDNAKAAAPTSTQGSSGRSFFFLRDEKNAIHGGAYVNFVFDLVSVEAIWVAEAIRGNGHGARLYRAIEDLAYIGKRKRAVLSTFEFQQALPFWERMGFQKFAELPGRIAGNGLIYMHKEINSEDRQKP